ncbi:MAG: twin-arginine translocase subunit TatC, partial [Acidimicrobiia bacterium]
MTETQTDGQMSILDHLRELRTRVVISIGAVFVGACIAYWLAPYYFDWVVGYYRDAIHDPKANFIFLQPLDAFLVRLK